MSKASKYSVPIHYWMCSATVYHCPKGKIEEGATPAVVNVIFTTKEEKILSKDLTQAQRGAQQQLVERAGTEVAIDVIDVVFNSFTHLAFVTPSEFLGMSVKELEDGMAQGAAIARAAVH